MDDKWEVCKQCSVEALTSRVNIHVATLALGLRPRQGLARARAKRETWESRLMLPGVWESVRMNTHIPKSTPILGVGVPMDFRILRKRFQGLTPIGLESSLYHLKNLGT